MALFNTNRAHHLRVGSSVITRLEPTREFVHRAHHLRVGSNVSIDRAHNLKVGSKKDLLLDPTILVGSIFNYE